MDAGKVITSRRTFRYVSSGNGMEHDLLYEGEALPECVRHGHKLDYQCNGTERRLMTWSRD